MYVVPTSYNFLREIAFFSTNFSKLASVATWLIQNPETLQRKLTFMLQRCRWLRSPTLKSTREKKNRFHGLRERPLSSVPFEYFEHWWTLKLISNISYIHLSSVALSAILNICPTICSKTHSCTCSSRSIGIVMMPIYTYYTKLKQFISTHRERGHNVFS